MVMSKRIEILSKKAKQNFAKKLNAGSDPFIKTEILEELAKSDLESLYEIESLLKRQTKPGLCNLWMRQAIGDLKQEDTNKLHASAVAFQKMHNRKEHPATQPETPRAVSSQTKKYQPP